MGAALARLRPVAAVAGPVLALLGAYLYWTNSLVRINGVPMAGRLYDYDFGGPRICVAILAVVALVHTIVLLARRSATAAPESWRAIGRLGLALALVPVVWGFTLIFFDEQSPSVIGPGPFVVLVGG